jgi:hypothetical protein
VLAASAYAFETVGIDIHELVGFEKLFNLRPVTGKQGVIFISTEITESQMHDPRRWRSRDYPIRKIRILIDNDQIMLAGKFPYLRIGRISACLQEGHKGEFRRKPQPRRHVSVE